MSGLEPLQPRNLGSFVDVPVKAEKKALDAVQAYIDGLRKQVTTMESLRDAMALLVLELVREIRAREKDDLALLGRLQEIEAMVKAL